jgi:hypothetical protein
MLSKACSFVFPLFIVLRACPVIYGFVVIYHLRTMLCINHMRAGMTVKHSQSLGA